MQGDVRLQGASERSAEDAPAQPKRRWCFANVQFDETILQLSVAGAIVAAEPKPLEVLRHLLTHAGDVVTKDELLQAVWPGRVVTETSLTNCVAKLRQALGDHQQTLLRTVHGYGYRIGVPTTAEIVEAPTPPSRIQLTAGQSPPLRPKWRLLELLGRGGQGEAWIAGQPKTHERRVFKFSVGEMALAALKREVTLYRLFRETLGERPDFVRLYDWNFSELPYFIESEYCEGGSLPVWAERQGGLGAVPLQQRFALLAQVAETVATAHALGVLHKDLKPSNLFVDAGKPDAPMVKVADWGSGRMLDLERLQQAGVTALGFTRVSDMPDSNSGTPAYQPPEVTSGQPATAQGDVYALGVMLYQLVVADLSRPLAHGWERYVDDRLLRSDIAAAVDGDPARRLDSAAEFARRLRKLDARRQEMEQRIDREEEVGRIRAAAQSLRTLRRWGGALAVALLLGLAVSSALYLNASRAHQAAAAAAARAVTEAATARAVTDFLTQDLLSAANPMIARSGDVRIRDVLDVAARSLDQRFAGEPAVRASVQATIGSAYAALADRAKAEPLLNAALAYFRVNAGEAAPQTEQIRVTLGELYAARREPEPLRRIANEILQAEQAAGEPNVESAMKGRLALVYLDCVPALFQGDCLRAARSLYEQSKAKLGEDNAVTARIELTLADALSGNGRADEAVTVSARALATWRKQYGADHPLVLARSIGYGSALAHAGRLDEAIQFMEGLQRQLNAMYGADHPESLLVEGNLGQAYLDAGRPAAALPLLEDAYHKYKASLGERDLTARLCRRNRARALFDIGRKAEALSEMRATVALDREINGADGAMTRRDENFLSQMRDGGREGKTSKAY